MPAIITSLTRVPMSNHLQIGQKGEDIAASYLQERGYTILSRTVRTAGGEIDLIAKQGGTIVFTEVKAKSRQDGFAPSLRVDASKINRLRGAGEAWLEGEYARGARDISARIDVIGICAGKVVEHYEDIGV